MLLLLQAMIACVETIEHDRSLKIDERRDLSEKPNSNQCRV